MTTATSNPTVPTPAISYRWDINIYRSLAVLIVLLFHLKVPGFSQGFLGVDLFFLISGYVITQSLERKRGAEFSASSFFLGRIYRILPMVGFTVALTLILSVIFLAPTDLVKAAQSALATLFSVANIYFWATIDYFDPASAAKPLLHMWSLGVEEQFYIIFPLVFILFSALSNRRKTVFTVFALSTLATLTFAATNGVSENSLFYLLPFRMNQFLAGSAAFYVFNLAASQVLRGKIIWCVTAAILLAASVLLTLPSVYRFSAILTFLMMPIFVLNWSKIAEHKAFLPLHRVADWSYSIYVLHWPIIAFWVVSRGKLDLTGQLICGGLTIALAWLTYRFVEKSFSARKFKKGSWKDALKVIIAPMLILALICGGIIASKGLAFRVDEDLAKTFETFEAQKNAYFEDIEYKSVGSPDLFSNDKVSVVMMGDSFAGDMNGIVRGIPGVESLIGAKTTAFCRALLIPRAEKDRERCESNVEFLNQDFSKADVIFIAEIISSQGLYNEKDEAGYEAVIAHLRSNGFKGRFLITGPRPIYSEPPYQTAFANNSVEGLREQVAPNLVMTPAAMNIVSARMAKWAETQGVVIVPFFPELCDMESCKVTNDRNEIIYVDRTHLNEAAKPLVLNILRDVLLKGVAPPVSIQSDGFNGDVSGMSDADLQGVPDKFEAIKLSILRNDIVAAEKITDIYLDQLDSAKYGLIVKNLHKDHTDAASRRSTLLIAERILKRKDDFSSRYIAGLSYFRGVNVERDDAKVIFYWEHPRFTTNGAVQFRLSEIYGNQSSEFYNPVKSAAALKASRAAGFEPK